MKQTNYSEIKTDIKCLYIYDLKTEKNFKVGESHTGTFSRGADNDYWTSQGHNGMFFVFYTEEYINNEDMRKYEKKVLDFCKKVNNGSAGLEVFCLENKWKKIENVLTDVKEYIAKEMPIFNKYFESSVEDIRKHICKKLTFVPKDYEVICNTKGECCDCNKPLSKKIYRVTIEGDKGDIKVDLGECCFKKLCLNQNIIRSQHFKEIDNHFQKMIIKSNRKNKEDEYESIYNSDDESINSAEYYNEDEEIFDLFYGKFLIDSRSVKKYILKLKYKISEYKPEKIKNHIIWATLYLFFFKGKFDIEINVVVEELQKLLYEEEEYKYTLNNEFVLYILTFYTFFKVEKDTLFFNKEDQSSGYIIHQLRTLIDQCDSIKYDEKYKHEAFNYSEEQLNALNDQKVVTGVAGAGKSCVIIEKIVTVIKSGEKSKIICITPTHSSKDNLCIKLEKNIKDEIDFKVIHSLNINNIDYLINIKYKSIKKINIIIDELSMFDINCWFRIVYLLRTCLENGKKVCILFTGDVYQIKPINFEKETSEIAMCLYDISYKLEKSMRSECFGKIIEHKTHYSKYILVKFCRKTFKKDNFNDFFNSEDYKSYDRIITSTNDLKNEINSTIYKEECNKICIKCIKDINIDGCMFCNKCLYKYKYRNETNIKFYPYKLYYKKEENSYYFKIRNIETKITKDMYNKLKNGISSNIQTDIGHFCIKDDSESIIFIDREKNTYILKKTNCKDDLLFYNGETIYIQHVKDDIYKITNTDLTNSINIKDHNIKIHYITRDFFKNMQKNVCLTYAETVNKSQGRTYGNVLFILGDKAQISSDNVYVACTRHRDDNIDLLFISENLKINPSEIIKKDKPYKIIENIGKSSYGGGSGSIKPHVNENSKCECGHSVEKKFVKTGNNIGRSYICCPDRVTCGGNKYKGGCLTWAWLL